jgi:hypothetical protein
MLEPTQLLYELLLRLSSAETVPKVVLAFATRHLFAAGHVRDQQDENLFLGYMFMISTLGYLCFLASPVPWRRILSGSVLFSNFAFIHVIRTTTLTTEKTATFLNIPYTYQEVIFRPGSPEILMTLHMYNGIFFIMCCVI